MKIKEKIASLVIDLEADHGFYYQKQYQAFSVINFLSNFLKKYKIRATFFSTGLVIEKYKHHLINLLHENHEVGIHSFYHRSKLNNYDEEQDLKLNFFLY